MKNIIGYIALLLALPTATIAQTFVNVAADHGLNAALSVNELGSSVSFYDFDLDGWDDLSFGQADAPPLFYRNNQGSFEPIDLGISENGMIKHLTWVDFDNDGDADLFYTMQYGACRMMRNDANLTFTDISETCGFPSDSTHHVNGVCWGDYNKDGLLDAYLCHFNDQYYPHQYTNVLMKNLGSGNFEDVTLAAGVGNGHARSFQAVFTDFDGDTWPDIHVINDRSIYADALFRNNGDGTFDDVSASSNAGISIDSMSSSWADYDKDEDLDVYVTNVPDGNVLLNNTAGIFSDSSSTAGVEVFENCWSANWVDFDNDGHEDLYVCTMVSAASDSYNFAYKNEGDGTFSNISFASFPDDEFQSWANAMGDINNDGYADLCSSVHAPQSTPLWLNEAQTGNGFLKVGLEGTASNREGIGTWIKLYSEGEIQVRYTTSGEDYLSQDSQREIFGMGSATTIDSLLIIWTSEHRDIFYDLPADTTLHVVEGSTIISDIQVAGPTSFCEGGYTTLTAPSGFDYLWNTGETTQSIEVHLSGDYSAILTNQHGVSAESSPVTIEVLAAQNWYLDQDGDGYGTESQSVLDCMGPDGYSLSPGDCNDADDSVYPGAPAIANGIDNNCDGIVSQAESQCPGDFNGDNSIDVADLLVFLIGFGCMQDCEADLDNDGMVSTSDLIIFLASFGISCAG